jgi:hypothetical protein
MDSEFTIEDLFREMDGEDFESYREFEQAVIDRFNQHLDEFPPHYDYRDAITWADRNRWLQPHDGRLKVEIGRGAPA